MPAVPTPSGLLRFHEAWARLESRIAVWAVLAEIADLFLWVSLKGLAANYRAGNAVGLIFRVVAVGSLLGMAAYWALRRRGARLARAGALVGLTAGSVLGWRLGSFGSEWASNIVEWLQNASILSLIGGPRGLATRLTLLLAFLGGSLAAASGKHINIDIVTRALPPSVVKPTAIAGWALAAAVCFAGAYGFVDSIAVTNYRADAFRDCPHAEGRCETGVLERLGVVAHGTSSDFFLLRRQLVLDLSTLPKVLGGVRYDEYLSAAEWNRFIDEGNWAAHFGANAPLALKMQVTDETTTKMPAVVAPDTGEGRGLLVRDLNFIVPFGLAVIGLKFLLRILLVIRGEAEVGHAPREATTADVGE